MLDRITVHGARQHNLKNIDVEIPRNALTVITGLSGSGKSSLAFDTIYAEGHNPVPTFWLAFSFIRKPAHDQEIPLLLQPRDTELCLIRDLRGMI